MSVRTYLVTCDDLPDLSPFGAKGRSFEDAIIGFVDHGKTSTFLGAQKGPTTIVLKVVDQKAAETRWFSVDVEASENVTATSIKELRLRRTVETRRYRITVAPKVTFHEFDVDVPSNVNPATYLSNHPSIVGTERHADVSWREISEQERSLRNIAVGSRVFDFVFTHLCCGVEEAVSRQMDQWITLHPGEIRTGVVVARDSFDDQRTYFLIRAGSYMPSGSRVLRIEPISVGDWSPLDVAAETEGYA